MGIIEDVKEVVGLVQKADNMELYRKILDLQAEVQDLVQENRQLKEQLRLAGEFEYQGGVFWRVLEDGKREGPYCSPCWDSQGQAVHLHEPGNGTFHCPVCETNVKHGDAGEDPPLEPWRGR